MMWYAIIMSLLWGHSFEQSFWTYQLTGDIHYQMEDNYCIEHNPGDVPLPGTPHYEALLGIGYEEQKGSGLSLFPHLWLGPGGVGGTVSPPKPNDPHKPPSNDGEAGNPVVVNPDDPNPPPPSTGEPGSCATIGDYDDFDFGVDNYIPDSVGTNRTGHGATTATMTSTRRNRFLVVKDMFRRGILTTHFKNDILSETYCNTTMTTSQVWTRICSGRENWRPTSDNEVDAFQSVYYTTAGVVGFVSSVNSDRIWTNVRITDSYDHSSLAGHVMHEWTHLLGFSHSGGSASCGNEGDVSYEAGSFFGGNMESLDPDY